MKKFCAITLLFIAVVFSSKAQQILPGISVMNMNGNIIVSWKNEYKVPLANINIQRSYDSLRNYTTIGSVLNPQNRENGYSDATPPYNKMYYRLFIAFDGGKYLITTPVRPTKDTGAYAATQVKHPWQVDPNTDPNLIVPPSNNQNENVNSSSKWVYTALDNNVVLHLPDASVRKYSVVFSNDKGRKLFELQDLHDEFLIIEKVNFVKSGWYSFALFDGGKLIETNHFFIPKDGKVNNEAPRRSGNR